jgi:hypothetical protein
MKAHVTGPLKLVASAQQSGWSVEGQGTVVVGARDKQLAAGQAAATTHRTAVPYSYLSARFDPVGRGRTQR